MIYVEFRRSHSESNLFLHTYAFLIRPFFFYSRHVSFCETDLHLLF